MRFATIIGQAHIKKDLAELVQHNRLSHALLFLGKEGNGALPLALAFAQFVVCEKVNSRQSANGSQQPGPSLFGDVVPETSNFKPQTSNNITLTDSCGVCPACLKAQQLIHPDIHFSYPTVTKKPGEKPVATDFITEWREFIKLNPYGNLFDWIELIKEKDNSQGKITAEECNDIIRKLSLKSFESEYKILIMWMPEMLGTEGNKLLKLIEEPPPNTLFILVTENEAQVLPTIVSRCQLIKIPALETKDIETALAERNKTEPAIARQVAGVSEGNYREALQLVQHAEEDWQALLREWLNAILKTGPVAQAKWVEEISRLGREKQKQFLRYFNHLLEQAVHLRVVQAGQTETGQRRPGQTEAHQRQPGQTETGQTETGQTQPGQTETVRPGSERDFAERLNKIAGIEQQQAIIEELDRACYYIERNAHGKMLFHALTIKLYHIIQDKIVFLTD